MAPSSLASPPLTVGLAGAGPWAEKAYLPMLTTGPETRLAYVWARRPDAALAIASQCGAKVAGSFDELVERCDAVAFAVPPDVQAQLAIKAARAGRHLLLDKPLALTLPSARHLVEAVDQAGVVTQLMLTQRFRPRTAAFIAEARAFEAIGARLAFLSGAFLDGPYACAWRREHGALHDLGPHAFDLLEAALGPIVEIAGRGDPRRWVALSCTHESGAVSELSMTGVLRLAKSVFHIELYGAAGRLEFDLVAAAAEQGEPWAPARRTFAEAVRAGRSPELDAHRGLRLQELIDRAQRSLA